MKPLSATGKKAATVAAASSRQTSAWRAAGMRGRRRPAAASPTAGVPGRAELRRMVVVERRGVCSAEGCRIRNIYYELRLQKPFHRGFFAFGRNATGRTGRRCPERGGEAGGEAASGEPVRRR